jgi:fructose-specific phosphotransferase system component IIB
MVGAANQWHSKCCTHSSAFGRLDCCPSGGRVLSSQPPGQPPSSGSASDLRSGGGAAGDGLERRLCQVVGLNANHFSASGTPYHIQVEDRGPVLDRLTDKEVRRVNLIIYANYGEANARIIYGQDYDYPDQRTHEHNRFVQQRIQEIVHDARGIIEEKEQRQVFRIKCLIRDYYRTKDESTKREFEEANGLFPFLFSRAWRELKSQRAVSAETPPTLRADDTTRPLQVGTPPPELPAPVAAARAGALDDTLEPPAEVHYPLDPDLRDRVIEIERLIIEVGKDLLQLRLQGGADDILLQTCRKLVMRAKESLSGRDSSEFTARRLEMTRNSLQQTWRQIRSRLR